MRLTETEGIIRASLHDAQGGAAAPRLSREIDADGTARAILPVADEGMGSPAADQPHLSERFRRGGNVGAIAGAGIGLAGARLTVAQHREPSRPRAWGEGSVFTVRLPRTPRSLASGHAQSAW